MACIAPFCIDELMFGCTCGLSIWDCTRLCNRLVVFGCLYSFRSCVHLAWLCDDLTNHMKIAELWACNKWALLQYLKLTIIFNLDPRILDSSPHYVRFRHHCRPHHCRIYDNRQWCTLTIGYELENKKMIGDGLKPAVKHHITTGLWLEPIVFFFLPSSIPRTEARFWALPSIVAAALHHEASAWILKNGLIFLL